MLKTVYFSIDKDSLLDSNIKEQMDEAVSYIKECGYGAELFARDSDMGMNLDECDISDLRQTLFVTDLPLEAAKLLSSGYYCIGVQHNNNPEAKFNGVKYVFTDIVEVDIDSYVKAYQRYSGDPWEVIRTNRLLIRETTVEDVDEFYRLYKEPEMTRYMEGLFENPEDERRYQKDYIEKVYGLMGFGIWTVVRTEDNLVIGRAGYSIRNGFDDMELGFLIGKEYQGRGYAYEACRAILDYGREVLGFEKVCALVKKENDVSLHLCRKLGFVEDKEVSVEENIYGHNYTGSDSVNLSPSQYGDYIQMKLKL